MEGTDEGTIREMTEKKNDDGGDDVAVGMGVVVGGEVGARAVSELCLLPEPHGDSVCPGISTWSRVCGCARGLSTGGRLEEDTTAKSLPRASHARKDDHRQNTLSSVHQYLLELDLTDSRQMIVMRILMNRWV